MAGIIGAKRDGIGLAGVAPGVSLYGVKAMDSQGDGTLQDITEAIDWAIANHMDIINMSLGTNVDSRLLHDMVDRAYDRGIIVVAASGNSGHADGLGNTVEYPAKYEKVIAVFALLKQANQGKSSSELREEMRKYAEDLGEKGRDALYGYGFANYAQLSVPESVPAPAAPFLFRMSPFQYRRMQ